MFIDKIFALTNRPLGTDPIGGPALGPWANLTSGLEGLTAIIKVVSSIIGVMTIAAGIWFLFNFIVGGIGYISAGGDKNSLHNAQQRIQNALVGLIIVVIGWSVLGLASRFLNVDLLITRPDILINQLSPNAVPNSNINLPSGNLRY